MVQPFGDDSLSCVQSQGQKRFSCWEIDLRQGQGQGQNIRSFTVEASLRNLCSVKSNWGRLCIVFILSAYTLDIPCVGPVSFHCAFRAYRFEYEEAKLEESTEYNWGCHNQAADRRLQRVCSFPLSFSRRVGTATSATELRTTVWADELLPRSNNSNWRRNWKEILPMLAEVQMDNRRYNLLQFYPKYGGVLTDLRELLQADDFVGVQL